jgi:hypothetical protein
MSTFRAHVTVGAIISMAVVVAVFFYALVTDPVLLAVLFGVTVVGSFLPDVDSDSGIPFYMVFGAATLAVTGAALFYALTRWPSQYEYIAGVPLAVMILVWFVVGGIIKKFTKHRGIFHSVPAMAIAGLGVFLAAKHFGVEGDVALLWGAGTAVGYASHLALDEVHSDVNMDGNPFTNKKSLGTAMKLFSNSHGVTLATYLILAALLYTAMIK